MSRPNRSVRSLRTSLLTTRRNRRLTLESLEGRALLAGLSDAFTAEVPEPSAGSLAHTSLQLGVGSSLLTSDSPEANAPGLGTTIAGINFVENAGQTGFLHIPPDPIGAVGPNHVVSVVNCAIEWHTKAGVQEFSDQLGQNSSGVDGFFAPLNPVNTTFDPKVIYDQHAGRFVVVTLEKTDDNDGSTSGDAADTSRILVAVSDTSDPNGTWNFMAIDSKISIGGGDRWADYPGFAVDEEAVYITNNMFSFGTNSFGGVRLWIIPKGVGTGGIYDANGGSFTIHDPYAGGGAATTTQPAHIYGTTPGSTGTFLVSYTGLTNGVQEFVQVVRVDNPLSSPSFSQQYVNVGDIENTSAAFNDAPQSGSATLVETNDRRALNAVWRDNSLWLTATIVGSGIDAGQTTSYWWELDTANLASISVTQQGGVGAEDIATGAYTFMSSIAVDANENMAIGFAVSAPSIFPSAGYTGRQAGAAAGTTEPAAILAAGQAFYVRTFGGSRNRWGDYSGTVLDPADERTFWMFNEYAMTQGTPDGSGTGDLGRWATHWGSFTFNTPPVITSTAFNAAENQTAVGTVTATDADGDTRTFSETGGADAALLSISSSGVITFDSGRDFENPTDANTDGVYEIQVTVSDGHGGTDVETILVTVTDVNEAPTFTSSPGLTAVEDDVYTYNVIAADVDAGAVLTITAPTLPTWLNLTDHGDGTATLTGTPGNIRIGANNVVLEVSDGTNAVQQPFTITVSNTNDAPVINTSVAVNLDPIAEDVLAASNAGTLVSDLLGGITDVDPGAVQGIAVSSANNVAGTWQYTLDGTNWQDFGAVSRGAVRLLAPDATTRVRLLPKPNFNGTASLWFFAWDQTTGSPDGTADLTPVGTTGGTTAFSTNIRQAFLSVTPVNDAPKLNTGVTVNLDPIAEEVLAASNAGTLVSDLLGGITDVDAGAVQGIAVSSANNVAGTWQYTLDGTNWQNFGAVSKGAVRLLAADATTRVRLLPKTNFNGTASLWFFAWDQTSGSPGGTADLTPVGATGGTTAFSTNARQAFLSVTPVNDAPKLNTSVAVNLDPIAEDSTPVGTLVSDLLGGITDVDAGALQGIAVSGANNITGIWQYTLDGTNWQNFGAVSKGAVRLLAADATTRVRLLPNANFSGTAPLWFFAWDQTSGSPGGTADLTPVGATGGTTAFSTNPRQAFVTVTPVNDAPVLGGISGTIGYTLGNSAVIVAPSATVADVDSDDFDTGELRVRITDGASAANQLELSGFTIGAGEAVMQGTTQVGTRTSDGLNGNELRITLNANATLSVVEQLLRSVTFRATSTTGSRSLLFSVSDGDGDTSLELTKTVSVS